MQSPAAALRRVCKNGIGFDFSPRSTKMLGALWYCVYWAGLAAITPYYNVFYAAQGLTDAEIGVVSAVRQWISVPSSFFWSSFADRCNAHRMVLLITLVLSTGSRIFINWGRGFPMFVGLIILNQFFTSPVTVLADTILMSTAKKDGDYGKVRAWGALGWGGFSAVSGLIINKWGYLAGFITSALLTTPCAPATCVFKFKPKEEAVLEKLREAERNELLATAAAAAGSDSMASAGATAAKTDKLAAAAPEAYASRQYKDPDSYILKQQQQLQQQQPTDGRPASISIAASAITSYDSLKLHQQQQQQQQEVAEGKAGQDHSSHSTVAIPCALVKIAAAKDEKAAAQQEAERMQALSKLTHLQRLKLVLSSMEVWLFLWQALLQGYGLGLYQSYLFLTLQKMGGSSFLMGLTITVDCLAEFPAFYFKEYVLQYLSVDLLLHISVLTYAVRLALYAVLPLWGNPWLVLPVQLLHGLTYAWGWGAGTIKGRELAPPGLQATMQGLFQMSYTGVGAGIGGIVGGVLMQRLGMQWMWAITSVSVVVGWSLHLVVRGAVRAYRACRSKVDI